MDKRHPSERFRGGHQFVERWTNAKAFLIGFLTGIGYSAEAIAARLGDGTHPATIRRMWRLWHRPAMRSVITVPLTKRQRANVFARAEQHQLTPEEYVSRIVVAATMPKDRYRDLVGDPE